MGTSKRYGLKTHLMVTILLILGHMMMPAVSPGLDMGDSVLRDYPISLLLPQKRIELSLDHFRVDDAVDIFDIKDKEVNQTSSDWSETIGDMQGFGAIANIGVLEGSNIHTAYTFRKMDYGISDITINSLELSWKQHLGGDTYGGAVFFALDGGIRYNFADDQEFSEQRQINAALHRFVDRVDINIDDNSIQFEKQTDKGVETDSISRAGNPDPMVINSDLHDFTPFIRFTAGRIIGSFFPNIFAEYGNSTINSTLDFSLRDNIPDSMKDRFPDMPIDMNRHEDYIRTGLCVLWKYPYVFMARLEYSYLKLFRDSGLDYVDDNHIVKADINYFITAKLIVNLGGSYYHRQYNGIIPFMYNEYTQTTFDHSYGDIHLGLTYLFNW